MISDAGLLLPRELDERFGLNALIERHLADPRTGRNRQFPLPDLFRQSGGVSEGGGRGGQTQRRGVADRQSSARRASVNASGRAKERLGGIASSDHGGVVMTGDPEFEPLANAGLVAVEWLPRRRP